MWNDHSTLASNVDKNYREQHEKYPENKTHRFIVLGLSKGTVIFLPIDQTDLIYARFSFHRQGITTLHQINGTENFITICEELNLSVWGFKENKSHIYNFVNICRPISNIVSMNKMVYIAF